MSDWGPAKPTFAMDLDSKDELASYRKQFRFPDHREYSATYFCGHSLGLKPVSADFCVRSELDAWGTLGVNAHFEGKHPWYSYHEPFAQPLADLIGAQPVEVVAMNSLTVNLHLMLTSFFRPTDARPMILMDAPTFPSDRYAVESVIRNHGYDPAECLLCHDEPHKVLAARGKAIALVLLSAVNFLTGEFFDVPTLAAQAHAQGCVFGLDLAHAIGNVPLQLHDWGVDFAVWCSYKYLNSGPGAVGGCFVHERHYNNTEMPRLAGWWGNDPATRFRMQLEPDFVPKPGADGWQLSNPPILAMAPMRASLALFTSAGMTALRAKSERLTAYLEMLLDRLNQGQFTQLTPREPHRRGAMLALKFKENARELVNELEEQGIVCDFREPDVIRVAPCPLYNSFHDVWRFANTLANFDR